MEIIPSNKRGGTGKLIFNDFIYVKQKETGNYIRWRCVQRPCRGCLFTTLTITQPREGVAHNHSSQGDLIEVLKCRQRMKSRALCSHDKPTIVFAEEMASLTPSQMRLMPSEDTIKRTLRNNRRQNYPKEPASLDELKIEGKHIF
ncbi:hypothetical protein X975_21744, partial [Stegodyphus mimosarum]